jgi:hypothetical protein
MMYVNYPLSLRNVEDLLFERGIDICHETVRLWWNRFGPMFAAEIPKKRVDRMRTNTHWRWHLDEVYVKINGQMHLRGCCQGKFFRQLSAATSQFWSAVFAGLFRRTPALERSQVTSEYGLQSST